MRMGRGHGCVMVYTIALICSRDYPILWVLHLWWLLCLHPFHEEVGEGLGLDRSSGDVANIEPVELEGPLRDAPGRIPIPDDLVEGHNGHHRHGMQFEVVDHLPFGDENRLKQHLDMWVSCLELCHTSLTKYTSISTLSTCPSLSLSTTSVALTTWVVATT